MKPYINLLLIIFLLTACKKNRDDVLNDSKLEKFWQFKGYFDKAGNPINTPLFNPDTIFNYEVNMKFLWDDSKHTYVIQGQGPYDMYSGEYKPDRGNLQLLGLETADQLAPSRELAQYDSLFFNSLNRVSRYTVKDDELTLFFENDSKKMVFVLKANQYINYEKYISADINGIPWKGEINHTIAVIEYDYGVPSHYLDFGGTNYTFLEDGFNYSISFTIKHKPHKGIYHFNNDRYILNSVGGVMGICVGRTPNTSHIDTRSINGLVALTTVNRSFIEGYFHFDALQYEGPTKKTNKITNGKFLIPLNGRSLTFKAYKFN